MLCVTNLRTIKVILENGERFWWSKLERNPRQAGKVSVQGGSSRWAMGKKCAWADQQGNALEAWGGELTGESP